MNKYKINDFLFNDLNDIEPIPTDQTETEVAKANTRSSFQSVKDILTFYTNISLLKDEYDPKNDCAKGFNIVKKTRSGDSVYILMTFSGKIFEKVNSGDWQQTFPKA